MHVALRVTLVSLAAWMFASSARSDEESQRRYLLSRGDENWAWLRTPHATSDFFDPIKYPRLTKRREDIFLSIGCETRQYLEFFQNELWGSTGYVDNVSWLQRYMLHAELRLTRYVRLFVLEMACFAAGRRGREVRRVDGNPHYQPKERRVHGDAALDAADSVDAGEVAVEDRVSEVRSPTKTAVAADMSASGGLGSSSVVGADPPEQALRAMKARRRQRINRFKFTPHATPQRLAVDDPARMKRAAETIPAQAARSGSSGTFAARSPDAPACAGRETSSIDRLDSSRRSIESGVDPMRTSVAIPARYRRVIS